MMQMQIRLALSDTTMLILEEHLMDIKKLVKGFTSPCDKCPYKLGLVHMVANPCPQCKENGYKTYERFKKELTGKYTKDV